MLIVALLLGATQPLPVEVDTLDAAGTVAEAAPPGRSGCLDIWTEYAAKGQGSPEKVADEALSMCGGTAKGDAKAAMRDTLVGKVVQYRKAAGLDPATGVDAEADARLSELLKPVERKPAIAPAQEKPPTVEFPRPSLDLERWEERWKHEMPPPPEASRAMTTLDPTRTARRLTPRQGAEGPSDWDLFWYEWVEPYSLQYWAVFLGALLVIALAWWQQAHLAIVGRNGAAAANLAWRRTSPYWREIAVIGLLGFIAWRLT